MKYILIVGILFLLYQIAGFIDDFLELRAFRNALKEYNELEPHYSIPIPQNYKDLCTLKERFENFTLYKAFLHFKLASIDSHYDKEEKE